MSASGRQKVLVAWDGSPAAATAFPVAKLVSQQLGTELEALYVARDVRERHEEASALRDEVRRLGFALRVEHGDAASGIIRRTEESGVLLVVMTTHGRGLERIFRLGSVAEKVVARTTRPVLLVKPESTDIWIEAP